jgi:hypothetical protein
MKVTIKKDSEAAKAFESLKELKQKYKEMVESGELSRLQKIYQMAEKAWEGCDGCDGDDKVFWMNGFRAGYNTAKPDELSHELRYKDGTPMRKYNSPKLQAIEMEISDEEIEKAAQETYPVKEEDSMSMPTRFDLDQYNRQIGFVAGIMWYREQLKQRQ